jgi:hypothetical protein
MGTAALVIGAVQLADQIGVQIADLIQNTGCGSACTTASNVANSASTMCRVITDKYFGLPAPRTRSQQNAALSDMDAAMNWAINQCNNPALGDAGQRCINERYLRGATAPWCPGGGCDWYKTCRDPIANDPVVPDSPSASSGSGSSGGGIASPIAALGGESGLLLIGFVVLIGLMLWSGKL